jgi:hypothetical protein
MAAPLLAGSADRGGPPFHSRQDIEYAQGVLQGMGYLRAGDHAPGQLDDATLRAIRAFQRDHFIRPHGWLDLETMGALTSHESHAHPAEKTAAAPDAGQERAAAAEEGGSEAAGRRGGLSARAMPETASPVPLMATASGLLLLGGSVLLRRGRH